MKPPFIRRRHIDALVDRARFRFDTFPALDYQALPWLDLHRALRDAGTASRWDAMLPLINERSVASAVDVGCNVGWFSIQLAQRGIVTTGIESFAKYYRTALYARDKLGLENWGILAATLTPDNTALLPRADCYLFLSVWHHIVRDHGIERASDFARDVWERTGSVLFFESGEEELPTSWGLPPLGPNARDWFERYLASTCIGGQVRHLGEHRAFAPDGEACFRNLYAVVRTVD